MLRRTVLLISVLAALVLVSGVGGYLLARQGRVSDGELQSRLERKAEARERSFKLRRDRALARQRRRLEREFERDLRRGKREAFAAGKSGAPSAEIERR